MPFTVKNETVNAPFIVGRVSKVIPTQMKKLNHHHDIKIRQNYLLQRHTGKQ